MSEYKKCVICSQPHLTVSNGCYYEEFDLLPLHDYRVVPVCPGCGGLGIQFDNPRFRMIVQEIAKLKHKYYPTDGFPQPPAILRYFYLRDLIAKVEQLISEFGEGEYFPFACEIVAENSIERYVLNATHQEAEVNIVEAKRGSTLYPFAIRSIANQADLALYTGDVESGIRLFRTALDVLPDDASLVHDYAVKLLRFERKIEEALELFIKATQMNPKRALHFYQVGKVLGILGRHEEAIQYFSMIATCPDFDEFSKKIEPSQREYLQNLSNQYRNLPC